MQSESYASSSALWRTVRHLYTQNLSPNDVLRGPPNETVEDALRPLAVRLLPLVLVRLKHEVDDLTEANHEVPALVLCDPLLGGPAF